MTWAGGRVGRLRNLLVLGALVALLLLAAYAVTYEGSPNHQKETLVLPEKTYTWRAISPSVGTVTYGFDVPNGTVVDVMWMSSRNVQALRDGEMAYYIGEHTLLNSSAGTDNFEFDGSYYLVFGNNLTENVTVNYWYQVDVSGATWVHRGLFVLQFMMLYMALAITPYLVLRRRWLVQEEQGIVRPTGLLSPACPNCGGEVRGNPSFCAFCGHRLR